MAFLLELREDLRLTRFQADSIATLSRNYVHVVDSLWSPASAYFAGLPKRYAGSEAQQRFENSRRAAISYLIKDVPVVLSLLSKGQVQLLPENVAILLDVRSLERMKSGGEAGSDWVSRQ
jgi:hypothetical protein